MANLNNSVLLHFDTSSSIAHITLNRPRVLNAINVALLEGLLDKLGEVQKSGACICVISGAGTSFCSGEDLKETLAPNSNGIDPDELRKSLQGLQDVTRLITGSGIIYIASVQGWAVGGGAEIALAADIVIAGPQATFSFPEVIHGHAPTGGITARLPQLVGLQQAKKLLLVGEPVMASEALAMKLVSEICDEPLQRALQLAEILSKRSKRSLSSIKQSTEIATFPNSEAVLHSELDAASWCFADPKSNEAFTKFQSRKISVSHVTHGTGPKQRQPMSGDVPLQLEETLVHLLVKAATKNGNRPFLRFGSVDTTFSEFLTDVRELASGFLKLGVKPGHVIAGFMYNSVQMVRSWFAAMWIGAIWAPLHTEFRGVVLERALILVAPKLAIVDDSLLRHLPQDLMTSIFVCGGAVSSSPYSSFDSIAVDSSKGIISAVFANTSSRTIACLLMTSGSTGPSKACSLPHSYFISSAQSLICSLRLTSEDTLFCPFPLCHTDATSFTVIPALCLGTTAAISRKFSASNWWDEIRETRSTIADFMGATLSILFKAPPRPSDAENPLRLMWGVPVPAWVEQFEKRFSLRVVEVYGSTETGLPVVQPLDRSRVVGSCGIALPNVILKIVDATGQEVPVYSTGELIINQAPDTRFLGYYKNDEATSGAIKDGWFYTGDLCRLDSEGNLFFVGRKKLSIRRRGENISAFEVEESLLLHPDIIECAAYGVPSELGEEDIKVSVVRRPGSVLTEEDIFVYAKTTMTTFQIPRFIEAVSCLPRTSTGKVEKYKLQEKWMTGDRSAVREFQITKETKRTD